MVKNNSIGRSIDSNIYNGQMGKEREIFCINKDKGKRRKECPQTCPLFDIVTKINSALANELNKLVLETASNPDLSQVGHVLIMADWIKGDIAPGDQRLIDSEIDRILHEADRSRSECISSSQNDIR